MKVLAAGYNCSPDLTDDELPPPVETQVFVGKPASVEAQLVAFGVRFQWYSTKVIG